MQWGTTLAFIADCYSPALVLLGLILLTTRVSSYGIRTGIYDSLSIVLPLAFIYGFMFVDNDIGLWHAASLDYSTHTAFALVWVLFTCQSSKKLLLPTIISLVCYFILMMYLQYHSLADIVTTSMAVTPVIYMVMAKMRRNLV
ncbi:MAG: hypothetical protein H7A01_10745 [Hahellaceae bacterium]|nr:hypothetical protein [Hahellaceae bacterium]MCP5211040.1 hypothetical protein [Hahellaceae bacterium]